MPQPDEGEDPMDDSASPQSLSSRQAVRWSYSVTLTSRATRLLDQASNFDLLPNAIAWLVGEEDQVSIRPNPGARVPSR